jgi:hypothetical protein
MVSISIGSVGEGFRLVLKIRDGFLLFIFGMK